MSSTTISQDQTIDRLLREIGDFQKDIFSVVQKRIGFCLLVLGWLVTSDSARSFLNQQREIMVVGCIIILLSTLQMAILVHEAAGRSRAMADALQSLGVSPILYRHRVFNRTQSISLISFNALVALLIIYLLFRIGHA